MGLAEIDGYLGGTPTAAPADASGSGLGKIDAFLGKSASAAPKVPQDERSQFNQKVLDATAQRRMGPDTARSLLDLGGDKRSTFSGAVLDTLGLSDRPGAVPLTGNDATRTPAGVVLKPKSGLEVAAREAVLAPVTAGSLPVRLGAMTGLGALDALLSGKGLSGAGYEAALDLIIGGATEAVVGKLGKYAADLSRPLRGFEYAREAPEKAMEALRARLPNAKVLIPSIDATAKLTWDEAIDRLKGMTGNAYKQGRAELADWMKRLDKQITPKPNAGSVFKQQTEPEFFTPKNMAAQRVLDATAKTLRSPFTRAAADVATTTPLDDSGMPAGVVPAMAGAESGLSLLKGIAHKVMH